MPNRFCTASEKLEDVFPRRPPGAADPASLGRFHILRKLGLRDRVQVADHWSASSTEPVDLTVVVATCLETDRAVTTELTRAGHPHLLVRPRARGAVVGPLVLPGRTSCVACGTW